MNIETAAYLVSRALCKAYKARNRRDYPVIHSDPCWAMHKACNVELDTLIDIDRLQAIAGFNRAFKDASI